MKQGKGLRSIPGVGKSIEQDLRAIGIDRPSCLKNQNPEKLYAKMCKQQGVKVDRCMLYVLRCAVYFAKGGRDSESLKWWSWKDGTGSPESVNRGGSDENMRKHPR
jgi:hypothetical protein